MADVYLGCIFVFLYFIISSNAGLPELVSDNVSKHGLDAQSLDDPDTISKMMVHQPRYKCHVCEHPECTDELVGLSSCHNAIYCYKSSVRVHDGSVQRSRGCSDRSDHYHFTCRTNQLPPGPRKRHLAQLNVTCCKGDLCNGGEFPALPPAPPDAEAKPLASHAWTAWLALGASVIAVALFVLRRAYRLRVSRKELHKSSPQPCYFPASLYTAPPVANTYYDGPDGSQNSGGVRATAAGESTLRQYLEASATSGSGAGLPLMVQRTLARQLTLADRVGKGRYGEVWRAQWFADTVAVKIVFSRDEASWRRETEIYSTGLLRHDNILAYVGSDMTSRNGCTQLWLITHYHPLGSLYDYLGRTTISRHQMLVFCLSIVSGVLHLHTEIHGTQGKPAIAHRDLKSKNILVKADGECCVADLGLALTRDHVAARGVEVRQGTPRYMSPELLDLSMNAECFEAYRASDVYSLALVLWEVWSRVGGAGVGGGAYRPPYDEWAPREPGVDCMRKVVCGERARPSTPCAGAHPTMVGMVKLMQECWHHSPSVRLPALRIKKTLLKLTAKDTLADSRGIV